MVYHNVFICSSTVGVCVIFHVWLTWIVLPWTSMCIRVPVFNSLGYKPSSEIAGSHGNSMYNLLRNCKTIVISKVFIPVPTKHRYSYKGWYKYPWAIASPLWELIFYEQHSCKRKQIVIIFHRLLVLLKVSYLRKLVTIEPQISK